MSTTKETSRPPKAQRINVDDMNVEDLAILPVTETQTQRDNGTSIVQGLMDKGWVKPDNEDLLNKNSTGSRFNLVMPKKDLELATAKNNRRAKLMEGFRDHEMVKEKKNIAPEYFKGSEFIPEAPSQENNG